jgi:hypothetical protein
MFVLCFLISWWVEAAYVNWWIARRSLGSVKSRTALVVRNANVLSYALLAAISIGLLAWISRCFMRVLLCTISPRPPAAHDSQLMGQCLRNEITGDWALGAELTWLAAGPCDP